MSDSMQVDQLSPTQTLINNIQQKETQIYQHEREIRKLRASIKKERKVLYNVCKHEWYRDYTEPFDSICKKVCKICNLYANPYCN